MIIKRQHDEGLVYKDSAVETAVAPTFAVKGRGTRRSVLGRMFLADGPRQVKLQPDDLLLVVQVQNHVFCGGSRNRTLRLFASFRDPETQDRLALALPAFRNKAALIQFGAGTR
jgi:hypothetical protein